MWNEVAAIYRASKKKRDINWWTEWVCRPPAAVVVFFLKDTRVTPNQVTFLSFLVAAGSGAMIALLPGLWWLLAAGLVYEFSFVLDCADGQLARVRKVSSSLGHLLDFLMDEIKAMLIFSCVAFRLWYFGDHAYVSEVTYLLVGIAGLFALASGLSLTSFTRRPEYGAPPPTEDGQPAEITTGSGLRRLVGVVERLARIVVHYPSYIWLCCALNRIDVFFWAYVAINVLYLGRTALIILLRLGRFAPAVD